VDPRDYPERPRHPEQPRYRKPGGYREPPRRQEPAGYREPVRDREPPRGWEPAWGREPARNWEPAAYPESARYPEQPGYQEPPRYPGPTAYRQPARYPEPTAHREPAEYQEPARHPAPGRDGWSPDGAQTGSFRSVGTRHGTGARRRARPAIWGTAFAVALLAAAAAVFIATRPSSGKPPAPSAEQAVPAQSAPDLPATSATPAQPPAPPSSLGSNWTLAYDGRFDGSRLNTSAWGTCFPWEAQSGCANFGNSDEYQWYTPTQDQVHGGALHIVAQEAPTQGLASDGSPKEYSYRSGLVTSYPGYKFQYGYIQVVAQVPSAPGLWTALWLAAANQQWPPEIDILEHWDGQDKYFQYYHPADAPREDTSETLGNLSTGWHTYGLDWTATKITWFIDGHQVMSSSRNVPQQPMYFLADVAVYQPVQRLQKSTTLLIKSVSVWKPGG
jgi:hypothetical protein